MQKFDWFHISYMCTDWGVLHHLPTGLACCCQCGSQSSAQSQIPCSNARVCGWSLSACIWFPRERRERMMGNLCIHANKEEYRTAMKLCRPTEVYFPCSWWKKWEMLTRTLEEADRKTGKHAFQPEVCFVRCWWSLQRKHTALKLYVNKQKQAVKTWFKYHASPAGWRPLKWRSPLWLRRFAGCFSTRGTRRR